MKEIAIWLGVVAVYGYCAWLIISLERRRSSPPLDEMDEDDALNHLSAP